MTEGVTRELAAYVVATEPGMVPEAVVRETRRAFVNFVGCSIGGTTHPAFAISQAAVHVIGGAPQAGVLGTTERTDMASATYLNGLGSAVHTFDDTHLPSIVHPTGPVAAAALAVAEDRRLDGSAFLNALYLGVETSCRIGAALMVPPAKADLNLFMTGLACVFGAAVTAGKLLRLDASQMVNAIGIASTQAAGLREMHGTMCSGFVPAQAGRNGLWAALLASKGFDSSPRSIEGPKGFGAVFGQPASLAAVTDDLGGHFEILANTYKAYPCGIANHPAIDACLDLVHAHRIEAASIARCEIVVHPLGLSLTGRKTPATGLEAQVSVYHWAAAALVRKAAGLPQADDACVRDPAVVAMRERVFVTAAAGFAPEEAEARLILHDGREVRTHVAHCRGSKARPLTDEELAQKFLGQAEPVLGYAGAHRLLDCVRRCDALADMGEVARTAAPA